MVIYILRGFLRPWGEGWINGTQSGRTKSCCKQRDDGCLTHWPTYIDFRPNTTCSLACLVAGPYQADCGTIQTVLLGAVHSHVRPGQLPGRSSVISGELQTGGDWSALLTPQKATLDSLRTQVKCHCNVQPGRHNEPLVEHRHPRSARGTDTVPYAWTSAVSLGIYLGGLTKFSLMPSLRDKVIPVLCVQSVLEHQWLEERRRLYCIVGVLAENPLYLFV